MKLLIVEDNQVIRELNKSAIGDLGHAVATPQEGSAINPTLPYNSIFRYKGAIQRCLLPKLFFWDSLPCY